MLALVDGLDRLFDRIYTSRYNPLHRTGTLAALCLAVALATGVYLLLVYEIGRPYESGARIQADYETLSALNPRSVKGSQKQADSEAIVKSAASAS